MHADDEDGGSGCVGTITREDTHLPDWRACYVSDCRFTLLGGIFVRIVNEFISIR